MTHNLTLIITKKSSNFTLLKLPPDNSNLQGKSKRVRLIVCSKTYRVFESFSDFFEFASKRTRSNHNYKLQVKSANCNCYKYSFFVNIIRERNDLPANVVEIGNLRRFKIALKSYMRIS